MKKHLTLFLSAMVVLSFSPSAALIAQNSAARFNDGIYGRPAKVDKSAMAVSDSEIKDLAERTRSSQMFLKHGQNDTLFIPEGKIATFKFNPDSTTSVFMTDPYDSRYSLYPYGCSPWYTPFYGYGPYWHSWCWHDPWYWNSWYWHDPWYWDRWAWDPWWYWDSWYWDPWWGPCGPWGFGMYGGIYGGMWGIGIYGGYYPGYIGMPGGIHGGVYFHEASFTPRSEAMGMGRSSGMGLATKASGGASGIHQTGRRTGMGSESSVRRSSATTTRQMATGVQTRSAATGSTGAVRMAGGTSTTRAASPSASTAVRRSSPVSAGMRQSSAASAISSGAYSRTSGATPATRSYESASPASSVSRSAGGYSGGGYSGGGGFSGGGAGHGGGSPSGGGGHRR